MIRRDEKRERDHPFDRGISPLGKDESGASEILQTSENMSQDAGGTASVRKYPLRGEREPALESEDGDMFLHSEDDTDY